VYQAQLRGALETARRQRARAEDHYEEMLHAVDVLLGEVGDQRLENVPEMEEARARLLEEALRFYRRFTGDGDNPDPDLRRETGRALRRTSRIRLILGDLGRAEADGREAVAVLERLCAEFPGDDRTTQDLARACGTLAGVCDGLDRPKEAVALTRRAVGLWESLLPRHPELGWALALGCCELGERLKDRPAEGRDVLERGLRLTTDYLRDHPEEPEGLVRLGALHLDLGMLDQTTGDEAGAAGHYRQAVTAWEKVTRASPRTGPTHRSLASAYNNLGVLARQGRRLEECEDWYRKARDLRQEVRRRNPRVPACADDLAGSHESLAELYLSTGRTDLARQALEQAVEVREPLARESPKVGACADRLSRDYCNLALLEAGAGKAAEAVALYRKALAVAEALAGGHPDVPEYQCHLGMSLFMLGFQLGESKQPKEAISCCTRAIEVLRAVLRRDPGHAEGRLLLRGAYAARANLYKDAGQGWRALGDLANMQMLDTPPPEKDKSGRK
jgi:tetratricopeptide (TPR) repeat protein